MLGDLAALTPPAVVGVAFLIGLGIFLRHSWAQQESAEDEQPDDISDDSGIPHTERSGSATSSDPGAS